MSDASSTAPPFDAPARPAPGERRPARSGAATAGGAADGPRRAGSRRPRASLSMDAVVAAAVAMLDADGEAGLTFRGLAAQLGGGVASIYWYVRSKDELLSYATDHVVARVLPTIDEQREAPPLAALRAISVALFEQMDAHPWAAAHLMHDLAIQENAMLFWEGLGQHLLRLELDDAQRFQAVSALVNYVVGMGAQMAIEQPPQPQPGENDVEMRDRVLDAWADQWMSRPEADFPFSRRMAPLFRRHDDFEQFVAGLDLILAGLERQAGLA